MNETAHTATRIWQPMYYDDGELLDREGCVIAHGFYDSDRLAEEDDAIGAFIERAVNAHDDMLAALKAADAVIEFGLSYYGSSEAVSALAMVRAAISKATAPTA